MSRPRQAVVLILLFLNTLRLLFMYGKRTHSETVTCYLRDLPEYARAA
jgi:hypothetical protein